jgi:hypothetical protein
VNLEESDDCQPVFTRIDAGEIASERGVPLNMEGQVTFVKNKDGTLPVLGGFCTNDMDGNATLALGSTAVMLLSRVRVGGLLLSVGDVVFTMSGNEVESTGIVVGFSHPRGDSWDPRKLKMIYVKVKSMGRHKQRKVVNVVNLKGAALTAKDGWVFGSVTLGDVTRSMVAVTLNDYFGETALLSKDMLTILFGEQILDQINYSLHYGMLPLVAVREHLPVMSTFQMILNYTTSGVMDTTMDFPPHVQLVMRMAIGSSSAVVLTKYSKLGTEIKDSTAVEAWEVPPLHTLLLDATARCYCNMLLL